MTPKTLGARARCVVFSVLLVSAPAFAQVELGGIVRDPDVRGLHRARPWLVPRRLHRHAAERRGPRQGAALHLEPPVHDRAAVPGAVAMGGTLSAARASHLERGGRVGPRRGLGHGRRLSARQSGSGWTDARTRRRTPGIPLQASRPAIGRATRSSRAPRTSRPRGSGAASASRAAISRRSPSSSRGVRTC